MKNENVKIALTTVGAIIFIVAVVLLFKKLNPRSWREQIENPLTPPPTTAVEMVTPTIAPVESAAYGAKFFEDTTIADLQPKIADIYLPDFTDVEYASPVTFGADTLQGRRVIAYNAKTYVEIYLADVDGGVWAVSLVTPLSEKDTQREVFKTYLSVWTVPNRE